jgi:hypothetical protein
MRYLRRFLVLSAVLAGLALGCGGHKDQAPSNVAPAPKDGPGGNKAPTPPPAEL